jgi:hypothetical protein
LATISDVDAQEASAYSCTVISEAEMEEAFEDGKKYGYDLDKKYLLRSRREK